MYDDELLLTQKHFSDMISHEGIERKKEREGAPEDFLRSNGHPGSEQI